MAFSFYEVWTIDHDDREELFDTAANLPEATRIANSSLVNNIVEVVIYEEISYGEVVEVKRIKKS